MARAEFTVSGRALLKDGAPFTVKGVCYNPTPIGDNGSRSPNGDYYTSAYSAIWDRDLTQLRAMGANVIRIYGWNPTADHTAFLNRCYNNGDRPIYVLVNYWVDPNTDWTNAKSVKTITNNFVNIETRLGANPAVLGLIIGNEVNAQNSNGWKNAFWAAMNSVATSVKAVNSKRLLSVAITDALDQLASGDGQLPALDFWCVQVYRGGSFGSFFSDYAARSSRPVVISEYGIDAYDHGTAAVYPNGASYPADLIANLWTEMSRASSVCAGGCVFEYCDEWFRAPGTDTTQDPGGWYASGFPDGVADEEYFGLFSIAKSGSGPDTLTPRSAYYELAALWNPAPPPPSTPPPSSSISDSSFETLRVGANTFSSFVYNPVVSGWVYSGTSGITGNYSGFTAGNTAAPDGTQVAFVQMQGSISTQVSLSAGTYTVSAQVANRVNWNAPQVVVVSVDGSDVGRFSGGSSYQLVTTSAFTVTAGTHDIRFTGQSSADATLFLDTISVQAAAATAVNVSSAGFEAPDLGSYTYSAFQYAPATVIGSQDWVFSGYAGVTANGSGFTASNPAAPQGKQVAFVQMSPSSVSQTISFPATGSYRLTVSAAQRGNWNQSRQVVQVYLDSTYVGSITPSSTSYQSISVTFSASVGAHALSFRGTATDDSTVFLDNVAITAGP